MSFAIKYTSGQYKAKLEEIKGYYKQLTQHLDKMKTLQSQIGNFWKDEHARETAQILESQITRVEYAMQRTEDMITFYTKSIEQLGGMDSAMKSDLEDALKIVSSVGTIGGSGK